jgi:hypothetical protein
LHTKTVAIVIIKTGLNNPAKGQLGSPKIIVFAEKIYAKNLKQPLSSVL